MKYLFTPLRIAFYLSLILKSFLYFLDMNPLCNVGIANILPACSFPFHSLNNVISFFFLFFLSNRNLLRIPGMVVITSLPGRRNQHCRKSLRNHKHYHFKSKRSQLSLSPNDHFFPIVCKAFCDAI